MASPNTIHWTKNLTTIINPKLVVEIVSPSTEAYDRGAKFHAYLDLDSMVEYVLISEDRASIETFVCRPDGLWNFAPGKASTPSQCFDQSKSNFRWQRCIRKSNLHRTCRHCEGLYNPQLD